MFPEKHKFNPTAVMSVEEYNKSLVKCWQVLQSGRRVAVHRSLIQITDGDIKAAVFLSQLLYWLRVGTELDKNDGWIFKSIQEMEWETGLSTAEQRSCKDKLKAAGFIETKIIGGNRNLAFKLNIDAICKAVSDNFGVPHINEITLEDWRKQELDFIRDYFSDSIVYHMKLVHLTGDIYIAIMLSDILYNCSKGSNIYTKQFKRKRLFSTSTIVEWENRTFLSRAVQARGRKFLKHHNLIVETHYARSARIFTHPDGLLLMQLLQQRTRLPKVPQQQKSANAADPGVNQPSLLPQPDDVSGECGNVAISGIRDEQDTKSCNSIYKKLYEFFYYNNYKQHRIEFRC